MILAKSSSSSWWHQRWYPQFGLLSPISFCYLSGSRCKVFGTEDWFYLLHRIFGPGRFKILSSLLHHSGLEGISLSNWFLCICSLKWLIITDFYIKLQQQTRHHQPIYTQYLSYVLMNGCKMYLQSTLEALDVKM